MRIPPSHGLHWGWCPWVWWTRKQGIPPFLPACPSSGCAMWRPDILRQHLRVGGEHCGSCRDASQMLTRACSLSPHWLAEDKGKRQWEFYRTCEFPLQTWPQRVSDACVSTGFFFFFLVYFPDLGILFHGTFCPFWFSKPDSAITFHSTSAI